MTSQLQNTAYPKQCQSLDIATAVMLKVYADSYFGSRFPVSVDGSLSTKKENTISGGGGG